MRDSCSFACDSSAPVRVEQGSGAAAWVMGALGAPSGQGHRLSQLQGLWPHQSFVHTCSGW